MKRTILHVTIERGGGWKVAPRGGSGRTFKRKSEAVAFARKEGRRSSLGQVVVHGRTGKIQEERTYGKDPRKYPD